MFIQAHLIIGAPVRQVHKGGVYVMFAQQLNRVECTVGFAQGTEHFTNAVQVIIQLEVAEVTYHFEVFKAFFYIINAALNKLVGTLFNQRVVSEHIFINGQHLLFHFVQLVLPWAFLVHFGKQCVNTGFVGFLMLQQAVSHACVSRDHKYALIQSAAAISQGFRA